MNHTYLDPSSRHVSNWCVVTYLHDYGLMMVQRTVSNDASTCTILRQNDTADVSTKVRVIDNVMRRVRTSVRAQAHRFDSNQQLTPNGAG